ncbi:MAG: hypothetical protein ACJ788_14210 [Ktedonobacteraceae bacterium]
MKPALEDLFMGPMASPSLSEGFRWEDSRRRVRVIFAGKCQNSEHDMESSLKVGKPLPN